MTLIHCLLLLQFASSLLTSDGNFSQPNSVTHQHSRRMLCTFLLVLILAWVYPLSPLYSYSLCTKQFICHSIKHPRDYFSLLLSPSLYFSWKEKKISFVSSFFRKMAATFFVIKQYEHIIFYKRIRYWKRKHWNVSKIPNKEPD